MLVKLVADKSVPELAGPSADVRVDRDRLVGGAVTPLVAEAASVDTEVGALLKEVRPDEEELELAAV